MSALIELNKATKTYGRVTAFRGITLSVSKGEVIALAGPNGSGKTTLLRSIVGMARLDSPLQQSVLGTAPPIGLAERRRILYVPDDDSLIDNLTAMEYFGLVAHAYGEGPDAVKRAVKAVKALDFDAPRMHNLLKTYSHGMRKKVQLASVTIPKVELIIVDEPTNGLDPTSIILLKALLQKLESRNTAIILSTHNLAFAEQLARRVILMKNRILYDGSLAGLRRKTGEKTLEGAYASLVMGGRKKAKRA
jgi:ABC-2 type transport system ATP-binding protein